MAEKDGEREGSGKVYWSFFAVVRVGGSQKRKQPRDSRAFLVGGIKGGEDVMWQDKG